MTAATCREVQGAIARDGASPELGAATARHLRDCAACSALDGARARIREGILAADDQLDDLTRARVLARLLEERRPRRATAAPARGRWAWLGWTVAFAAGLVLAVTGVLHSRRPAGAPPFALEPYAVHGRAASSTPSGGGLDRVELPARASMRARLGPAADFVLVGPLQLAVRDGQDTRAAVELRRGTLVGDFDGSTGRQLRIVTADATVDVVGTRFLVEASAQRTRVSVEHGRVRVESHGQVRFVGARQEWSTDQPDVASLGAARASLFERAARGNLEELAPEAAPAAPPPVSGAPRPAAAAATPAVGESRRATKRRRTEPSSERARTVAVREEPFQAAPVAAARATEAVEPASPRAPIARPAVDGTAAVAPPATASSLATPLPSVAPAPPAPAPTPVAPAPKPRETPSSLYRRAEAALRQGDDAAGKKLLDQLVDAFPDQPATDSARYELAVMAEKAGQSGEALAQTREILRPGAHGPFVEPAQFLRCRVYLAQDRGAAAACLTRFVRDFPGSPHDEVALRALIDLSREGGRCDEARRFAEAYLQRHPSGRFGGEANRVRSHCGP